MNVATDLETILERATSGRQLDKTRVFKPSWFYSIIEDPFGIWCEYHAAAKDRVEETTLFDEHRMQLGNEWEDEYVAEKFPEAHVIESRWGTPALHETVQAMLRGEATIHGAALWLLGEDVYGKADLLVRCDDHASDLGNYHYRVQEVKNSKEAKQYHQLQAAVYTWILAELQGYRPDSFDIVLRRGAGQQTVAFHAVADEMHRYLGKWRQIRDGQLNPDPRGYNSTPSPWRQCANLIVKERRDVSLLPGVGLKTAAKMRGRGISSTEEIVALGVDGCVREFRGDHYYYHALAIREGKPLFRPGESAAIQRRERLVYFDVEDTSTLDGTIVTRPHVYMLGVATPDDETHIFTAHGEDDEARMWSDFLDWLGDPAEVALYCWTMYEDGKIRQAASDHPHLKERLMAASASLIDLKEEVKHRPYFPTTSYSIKELAPICGFHWSQGDVDGLSAQLIYLDWLKSGDDAAIRRVEQYNREDVLAMLAVDRYVSGMDVADTCRRA